MSLVADEASLSYLIRDAAGNILKPRSFDAGSDLPLDALDVRAEGDSLTFNGRGLLVGGGAWKSMSGAWPVRSVST